MKHIWVVGSLVLFATAAVAEPGDPIRMGVSPADVPTPSMKYRLSPDPRTLKDGNAATLYYRTLAMFVENRRLLELIQEDSGRDWLDTPLDELPLDEMKTRVRQTRNFLREMELASQYRDCDWRLHNREEGFTLLLPDIQGFRLMGTQLAVRARLKIAQKKYDEAIATLRIGYTLGRHLSKGSSLVQLLVGVAIAREMDTQLDTLIAQPGSPNLYWALATCPRSEFDLDRAIEGETTMLESMWPWLKELDGTPMSLHQVQIGLKQLDKSIAELEIKLPDVGDRLVQSAMLAARYEKAKKALIDSGVRKSHVEAMPRVQAVALWAYRNYRNAREDQIKWLRLPNGIRHPKYKEAVERSTSAIREFSRLFFHGLLTALGGDFGYGKVQESVDRYRRGRAARLALEAIRLHAAEHGDWPKSLDDIEDVIVLPDPISGKPFIYRRVDNDAVLVSPRAPGEGEDSVDRIQYELRLRKK